MAKMTPMNAPTTINNNIIGTANAVTIAKNIIPIKDNALATAAKIRLAISKSISSKINIIVVILDFPRCSR